MEAAQFGFVRENEPNRPIFGAKPRPFRAKLDEQMSVNYVFAAGINDTRFIAGRSQPRPPGQALLYRHPGQAKREPGSQKGRRFDLLRSRIALAPFRDDSGEA
jgi:hypothetical protein